MAKANKNKEERLDDLQKIEAKLKGISERIIPIMRKVEAASQQMA